MPEDTNQMERKAAIAGGGSVLTLPMIRAIMSRMTSPDKQGALFGGIAGIETACGVIGSLTFNAIYAHTISFFRGTVFIVMAGIILTSLLLLVILAISSRQVPILSEANLQEDVKQKDDNVYEIALVNWKTLKK
ncbi:solute carrier family 46 member 3-like isoform X3 [Ostrea edulis]|uniref:solute carrier family 46 member 3-like isoform X3 n=1 Tax=Ostrea edulis TaxID=37623 RepID=UPI0024AE98B9|nr:solute carrier family 46 member 3-like isoform X3 [Ostrea edulis]